MKIITENKPIDKTAIHEFEKKISHKLPKKYRDFLLKYNGGEPDFYIFSKNRELGNVVLNVLYGLHSKDDYDDIEKVYYSLKDRIPNQFISIGDDPGGNQFLIGLYGSFEGKIFFWDHNAELENNDFTKNVLPKNMHKLADSFDAFINGLEEDREN